jgi:uncharacterized protein YcaQ
MLTFSQQTMRRFILGKQGLWPGRRWQGRQGVREALRNGCVIQVDPLCILARSHDIALASRVADYDVEDLHQALYEERLGFDWGSVMLVHPMEDVPYWKAIMQRRISEPYWAAYREQYGNAIDLVRNEIHSMGPVSGRSFKGTKLEDRYWRSGKDTGRALYYLWTSGELMTSHRLKFERYYDFAERIIPAEFQWTASLMESEKYLSILVFRDRNIVTPLEFKNWWAGLLERKVSQTEVNQRLIEMEKEVIITAIAVENRRGIHYIMAEDLPFLKILSDGNVPEAWKPVGASTSDEVSILAPLEIVSARGRANNLFGFDYKWEVYKPAQQRLWGYYTIPILYQDRLVARIDSRLDRKKMVWQINGYWHEETEPIDQAYKQALQNGLIRFMSFLKADQLEIISREGWPL